MGSIPSKELLLRAMLALNVFNARLQTHTGFPTGRWTDQSIATA